VPTKSQDPGSLVFSYLQLRKAIGALGLALPFVLAFGAKIFYDQGVQSSISSYYWTGMRDILVGTLFAIGFFLLSYQGYGPADNRAGNMAFVFALGVALFPTTPDGVASGLPRILGYVHFAFAALFFGTLIYFCLVLFTKTDKKRPTREKVIRNRIYRGCGYAMAACILLTLVYALLPASIAAAVAPYDPIYWLESIAILTFGLSWIVKGEWILKDG
jgi:hypothetical protein